MVLLLIGAISWFICWKVRLIGSNVVMLKGFIRSLELLLGFVVGLPGL